MAVASARPGRLPATERSEEARAARAGWIGAVFAFALHLSIGAAVVEIDPARFRSEAPIELVIEESPPPEVRPPVPEPPSPPPSPARPRPVARKVAVPPQEPTPPAEPPPPNEPPPPAAEAAPPVFGGTLSSVVSGAPSTVAIPVGNTLMSKPNPGARTGPPRPSDGEGGGAFTPVAEIYIAKQAELLYAPDSADEIYPPEARRMGIEGVVRFKLGIDEKGNVVRLNVTERAGHGFDEAASRAMRRARFRPAIGTDGRPVPCNIPYTYRFEIPE